MKNSAGEGSEALPQIIIQKIKPVYDKYKDIVIKGIKPSYNKYRDMVAESKPVCDKYKNMVVKQLQNRFNCIKTGPIYREFKENKKLVCKIIVGAAVSLFLATFIFLKVNNSYVSAYSVEVDNNVIAIVREKSDFVDVLKKMRDEALSLYGQEISLDKEPEFIETKARREELTQYEEMIKNIKAQLDVKLRAAAIGINGERIVAVKDNETAYRILDSIKDSFVAKEELEYDYVGFVEKVEVMETTVDFGDIMDEEEALRLIAVGTDETEIHEIKKGENTWTIALKYGIKMEDIMEANPGIEPTRLQIGQKISLTVPKPLISVKTRKYIELVEEIPFETEYEKTDVLYKGDKKIIAHGEEGKREVKGYLVKRNGIETDREVIEEKILLEPKTRVIAEGTKPRPATMATGFFINPTRGRLTSSYGMRWGSQHTGIDIASPRGTPIFAADAGKVSFSGVRGTYGKLVIIDHENGYQTYYAHNSKNLVKQGERVYKGQKVAEMGSTGRSTGVHLHFEVRKNGTPINPQKFVKY